MTQIMNGNKNARLSDILEKGGHLTVTEKTSSPARKRDSSPGVKAIESMIAAKQAELDALHNSLEQSKWRSTANYSPSTKAGTDVRTSSPSHIQILNAPTTTTYEIQHRVAETKYPSEDQLNAELAEFKSFEAQSKILDDEQERAEGPAPSPKKEAPKQELNNSSHNIVLEDTAKQQQFYVNEEEQ